MNTAGDQKADLRCDTLLLVATDDEENALLAAARSLGISVAPLKGRFSEYHDFGRPGVGRVLGVRTEVGTVGHGAAATKALLCKNETGAPSVIAVGIAFGVDRDSQTYGDVLISTALIPYDRRIVRSNAGLPKYDFGRARAYTAKESLLRKVWREVDRSRAVLSHGVHQGALLSGQALVECRAYRDHLAEKCSKLGHTVIGGEMEGVGLVGLSPIAEPAWLVVKAISDFADERRDASARVHRKTACSNAAELVLKALKNEVLPAPVQNDAN